MNLIRLSYRKTFLRSHWDIEFRGWLAEDGDRHILQKLERWAARHDLKETSAEAAFTEVFFREIWGYVQSGQAGAEDNYTLFPKFAISGAGAKGGTGEADLAIGYFSKGSAFEIPQVLCEFKDMRSPLDVEQKRKGNTRSPVRQCLDYLAFARRGMVGSEPVIPTWAIVSDMNEFRLYWYDRGHQQSLRFIIQPRDLFHGNGLLAKTDEAQFERFLFQRVFHRETLLSRGGRSVLLNLIQQQKFRDRDLEKQFYGDYKRVRDRLYLTLLEHNAEGTDRFPGTRGRLVRLAQKLLDRMIFVFFCEDMGRALMFPPQLLRNFLINRSNDEFFNPASFTIWEEIKHLFRAMNDGAAFGPEKINKFNGGLFSTDFSLEKLKIPNSIFCQKSQGQNEASLYLYKETVLYLCASYNYASSWSQGLARPPLVENNSHATNSVQSIGLYTLGRIFEQSITELEMLEAEADGRASLNKENKRKTDGVYYTPEWVVERIVSETLGPRLSEIKIECGWIEGSLPTVDSIDQFTSRLRQFRVLDPACGSGAFLLTTLRYLVDLWRAIRDLRKQISGDVMVGNDDDALIRNVLRENIYGVDINSSSVEISKLALWLHTARGDQPLSTLDNSIREGNSLIDSSFYKGQVNLALYDDEEKERINAFDWEIEFPVAFENGGFDAVVGNPPYVKLQNFLKVHSDMADFFKHGRAGTDVRGYSSAQSGSFDLYLLFFERGLRLLNENGRLGYIAPSIWTLSKYGAAFRKSIASSQALEKWIDFKSYQIFEEAIVYTALQFFARKPSEEVQIAWAPDGTIQADAFQTGNQLRYDGLPFGDRWLLTSGAERSLIDKLQASCYTLDDPKITTHIFQGLITSSDDIYHLTKLGPGRYLSFADGSKNGYEVEIEDELMKPLVSGPEAKRYISPITSTHIIFPYDPKTVSLYTTGVMESDFPKTFQYLLSWRNTLRKREALLDKDTGDILLDDQLRPIKAPFDNEEWYRFGRNQNLDKQEIAKLIVAQTVPGLRVCYDKNASVYLNNVRVNGIVPTERTDPWFLLGVLNSNICNFVFKRIAKVKVGGFYEANRQFIAPLPVPRANSAEQHSVGNFAQELQSLHSRRRDILAFIANRMKTLRKRMKPEIWLFPTLMSKAEWESSAPKALDLTDQRDWAKKQFLNELNSYEGAVGDRVKPSAALDAKFVDGELSFLIDGIPVISSIFENDNDGIFILAQWKVLATSTSITENTGGKKLCNSLRRLASNDGSPAVRQIIDFEKELSVLDNNIAVLETEINNHLYGLYKLSPEEITLVRNG